MIKNTTNLIHKIRESNPDSAKKYSEILINDKQLIDYYQSYIDATLQYTEILRVLGDYPEAMKYTKNILEFIEQDDGKNLIDGYIILGIIHYEMGQYDSALQIYEKAEELLDENDEVSFAQIYTNKANAFSMLGNYQLALEHYLNAAKVCLENDMRKELAVVYNNIGTENMNLELYGKSIEYFELAIDINLELNRVPAK